MTVPYDALGEAELSVLVMDSYRRIAGKKLLAQLQPPAPRAASVGSKKPAKLAKVAKAKKKLPPKADARRRG